MSKNIKTVKAEAALPIEILSEKLPSGMLDDLHAIHIAGKQKDYVQQMKLLDGMRKGISKDASDPKSSSMLRENLRGCLEAIDLMRCQTDMRMSGSANLPQLKLASDKAMIPPDLAKPLGELRERSNLAGPELARETSLFMSRVEACAKMGAFEMVDRYSNQMLEKLRESHTKDPQPQLGPIAAKVREVAQAANAIDQKIKIGVNVHSEKTPENTVVEGSAHEMRQAEQKNTGAGHYLINALKREPEPVKKTTLGLNM